MLEILSKLLLICVLICLSVLASISKAQDALEPSTPLKLPTPVPTLKVENLQPTPATSKLILTPKPRAFLPILQERLKQLNAKIEQFCPQDKIVTQRILKEYGAIYVGSPEVKVPKRCFFLNEKEVQTFQEQTGIETAYIGKVKVELQPKAMEAFLAAREEARQQGIAITPRGVARASRRSYHDTLQLWQGRVNAGWKYWQKSLPQYLKPEHITGFKNLPIDSQISVILQLEERGLYFSKDFSKSIIYSVAPPGASQHNMMLAIDIAQFDNERVRDILAKNGWYQTVFSDLPHFTYLGVKESELQSLSLGLRPVKAGNQTFWIPSFEEQLKLQQ